MALTVLSACGVTEDEAVRLKEGEKLFAQDLPEEYRYCSTLGCALPEQACLEVFFDFGASPALCLTLDVCERLECQKEGGECAIFDGFPGQVKCVRD